MTGEIEEHGHIFDWASRMARIGEFGAGVAQLVEEGVDHGIDGREALGRGVLEEARDRKSVV